MEWTEQSSNTRMRASWNKCGFKEKYTAFVLEHSRTFQINMEILKLWMTKWQEIEFKWLALVKKNVERTVQQQNEKMSIHISFSFRSQTIVSDVDCFPQANETESRNYSWFKAMAKRKMTNVLFLDLLFVALVIISTVANELATAMFAYRVFRIIQNKDRPLWFGLSVVFWLSHHSSTSLK